MIFNINDTVSFTLTRAGANIYNAYLKQFESERYQPQYVVAGQKQRMQFWNMMQTFGGDKIYMGMEQVPFEACEIELVK